MKIGNTILLSFTVILLLFSLATYLNFKLAQLVDETSEAFARSSMVVRESNRFQRNILNMASGLRGYVLTSETTFIQTYDSAVIENEQILAELDTLVAYNVTQSKLLKEVRIFNSNWVSEFAEPLMEAKMSSSHSDSSKHAFQHLYKVVVLSGNVKDAQLQIQKRVSEFTNNEYLYRDERKRALTKTLETTKFVSFSLNVVSIVAGIFIAVFLARHISGKVVKLVKIANQIADGDYAVTTKVSSYNEFDELNSALNDMARILSRNFSMLTRKNDELNQFAHVVSHDLKAPLRGIDNVVTWIEEDHSFDLPGKVRDYLLLIKGRITRAENLLHGILTYSRVGREEQEISNVSVNELINEVREYLPKNTGVELQVRTDLPVFNTEKVVLLQIFTNLIVNAFKYHDKPNGIVKVYHREVGDFFEFVVEDNGPGIDATYHQRIFRIFQTLRERDSFESTGVGLAIVKKILDDRKLTIKVDSEPGKGSKFIFLWPKISTNEKID